GVGFCLGEGQEIDWIGHTEYSETRIEQLDHIFNLIGITFCAFYIQNAGFRIDIEQIQATNNPILAGMMNASIRKHGGRPHHSARLPSSEC
ncbi:hypothetical protein, partial [Aeromonas caviae]|uniref:hypothetical protein n=1 Tax=Aeromonas caviae TaxID=648 RepID=UPI001FC81398